jgi:hypothetical protein
MRSKRPPHIGPVQSVLSFTVRLMISKSSYGSSGGCHAFRNPLEPYLDFEIIRGLEALLGSLSFLAPPGSDWAVNCPFRKPNKPLLLLR